MISIQTKKNYEGHYSIRINTKKNTGFFIGNMFRQGIVSFYSNVRCVGFTLNGENSVYGVVENVLEPMIEIRNNIQDSIFSSSEEMELESSFDFDGGPIKLSDAIRDTRVKVIKDAHLLTLVNPMRVDFKFYFRKTDNLNYNFVPDTIPVIELSPIKNVYFNLLDEEKTILNIVVETNRPIDINGLVRDVLIELRSILNDLSEADSNVSQSVEYIAPEIDIDISQLNLRPTLLKKLKGYKINSVKELIERYNDLDLTLANRKQLLVALEGCGYRI